MIQGDSDTSIPMKHAHYMKKKADELNALVEVMMIKNLGHDRRRVGADIESNKEVIFEETVRFFVEQNKEGWSK